MARCGSPTCLSLPEWTECCRQNSRFASILTDDEAEKLSAGYTPKSTEKANKWAVDNFEEWRKWRNKHRPHDPAPPSTELLSSGDAPLLNKWLSRYVVETRGEKGRAYPPATIHNLLCGLQHHMLALNPVAARFLDKKNPTFKELQGTLDNLFRRLHEGGAGRQVKHAEVITKQDENQLWDSGELGTKHPKALQNAVFYYNGKNFCLRGGVEHRELKISQLQRTFEPSGYIYHEYVSKNQSGTYQQLHLQSKVVPIYACPDAGERCHVFLLDLYLRKLPQEAIQKDVFYVRPLQEVPADLSVPWYTTVPVGKHTLNNKVKVMCERAGIQGHKTNHSLRATAATELYQADVPEKLIQERTGHRSLKTLRVYERTTTHQ